MEINMKISSKNFVLNTLSQDASFTTNKKLFYTLGHQLTQILIYLIEQYKFFENNNQLRKDGSFYVSNIDLQVFNTMNGNLIKTLKKKGIEEGVFKISLEGIPIKSYYYLDFDKIAEIATTNKTNSELAHEYFRKMTGTDIDLEITTEEDILNLNKLSYDELRFYCKKNKITYTGKDTKKIHLINLILKEKFPQFSTADFSTVGDITPTSGQKNTHCEIIVGGKTPTSEQENRPLKENEDLKAFQWAGEHPLVSGIFAQNQVQDKHDNMTCHGDGKNKKDIKIEKIFHELGINYTDTNEASCLLILNEFDGNKILLEKYLRNIHKQLEKLTNIKNLAALFSKKLKEIDYSLVKKIKNENINEAEKILKEQKKINDEKKVIENNNKMDKVINSFLNLDKEIQKDIVDIAQKNYLKEVPNINADLLQIYRKNSYRVYLKMIYLKLLDILKIEYPKIFKVGEIS